MVRSAKGGRLHAELLKGATVWFTGLPCSGKSTISERLEKRFRKWRIPVEVLDGDRIRNTPLAEGLSFSKEDRDRNIRRVGYLAELLTRHGVLVLAAVVSPYRFLRDENRRRIKRFVEVYVKASVEACARRDVKGHYRKALAGEIKGFTGVDDPYEEPLKPEVTCLTERESPEESADKILEYLKKKGYLRFSVKARKKKKRGVP